MTNNFTLTFCNFSKQTSVEFVNDESKPGWEDFLSSVNQQDSEEQDARDSSDNKED